MDTTPQIPEFIEKEPYEKGFAAHFKAKIAPLLNDLESFRLTQYASYKKRLAFAVPLSIAVFIGAIALEANVGSDEGDFIKIALGIGVAIFIWAYVPVVKYKQDVKSKFMPVISEFYGKMSYSLTGTSLVEDKYRGEIFPHYTSSDFEDFIQGEYKGIQVSLHETKLKQRQRRNTVTVFSGLVLELQFQKTFKGKTTLLKDGGSIGNFFTGNDFKGLTRVELEDPEFEKIFQVFSSDQVEARFVLTTAFMERLISLAKLRSTSGIPKVQCVFENKELVISIPCGTNLFEPGSIRKSALQVDDIHTFLAQMNEVFQLVDVLKLQRV